MTRDGLKKVLITGATSGIGEGLVDRYSKSHNVVACGRNEEKLSKLSGNNVQTLKFDMTEKAQVASAFVDIEQLDIVILNAGVCEYIDDARRFDAELFERVIHANVIATGYCIEVLLPKLKPGGQLVIVSSSASFLPLPRAQAYGASKAALSYLTRVMQIELEDIDVTLVHPGFVETPLTDKNDFPMPFLVTVENACEAIFQGVESRKKRNTLSKALYFITQVVRITPFQFMDAIGKKDKTLKKIAIIGSGISGMTAAYLLNKKHDITLFEKESRLGGHTATIDVETPEGEVAVDTGFIVFNDRTYPLFEKLLDEIKVGRNPTQMSFSVKTVERDFEYNGHTFASLFAQKRNILSFKFWRFLYNIVKFNSAAKALYHSRDYSEHKNLGEFLDAHGFDDFFKSHYILPMGAAIWSTSLKGMLDFEIQFFIRFFYNHGLLDVAGRPQWYVIPGGSKQYIAPLTQSYRDKIRLSADIKSVARDSDGVEVFFENGSVEHFDEVVFACHSDQALALLTDASELEKEVLGAIEYTPNSVVLHTDISLLPKRTAAWASWNYLLDEKQSRPATVTYQMNILQKIESNQQFCVTLNNDDHIAPDKVIQKFEYHHPVFNTQSIAAQKRKDEVDGVNKTYFCGAYWFNGFHEDGVRSAVDVAKKLGVEF